MLQGLKKVFQDIAEKIRTTTLSDEEVEKTLQTFFSQLVSNDVAVETAESIVSGLREELKRVRVGRFNGDRAVVRQILRRAVEDKIKQADARILLERAERNMGAGRPTVIMFVGPNGSGKTTTVVKLATYLRSHGYSVILASADTFRAGAIEQLETLGEREGFIVVKQGYGADATAVAVDAVNRARSMRAHFVLVDTAGRTETDRGLLEEMKKMKRVLNPDFVIYVGDALTGNAAVEQARQFNSVVGIDYVILAKLDADARGGSALSIAHATGKPLIFAGVGQDMKDLDDSPRERVLSSLDLA
ncbi:Signal recognition particle receptor FtsY [archaeon HR01]|nr:Signal recognition particle receptor FtsY [archaeon HR01]